MSFFLVSKIMHKCTKSRLGYEISCRPTEESIKQFIDETRTLNLVSISKIKVVYTFIYKKNASENSIKSMLAVHKQ